MVTEDGLGYAQALSRLIEEVASTAAGSATRNAAIRDIENFSRRRAFAIEVESETLRVDGDVTISFDAVSTQALTSSLLKHQVARLSIRQLTPARDLIEVASLLGAPPAELDGGAAIEAQATALRLWNAEFVGVASMDSEPVTASLPAELLLSLRDGADYAHAEAALAKLATRGEKALEEGDARVVGAVLVALDGFERRSHHGDLRHTCELAIRRLMSPMALRLTAQLIPSARQRESLLAVLARSESEGAEALFAHLVAAQEMHERRSFFDAIVALDAGSDMLIAALDNEQWFVARNAAELLGEMRVEGVEEPLRAMLKSSEERRRIAAASALARLRTPEALSALSEALNDKSEQVRYFANSARIARIEGASARQLGAALDVDGDPEMKLQVISALGRLGTPDAVQKLIKMLISSPAPNQRGATEMTSDFRCASIEAVASARGSAALSVIGQLRRDKDSRVAETAQRVYSRLAS